MTKAEFVAAVIEASERLRVPLEGVRFLRDFAADAREGPAATPGIEFHWSQDGAHYVERVSVDDLLVHHATLPEKAEALAKLAHHQITALLTRT